MDRDRSPIRHFYDRCSLITKYNTTYTATQRQMTCTQIAWGDGNDNEQCRDSYECWQKILPSGRGSSNRSRFQLGYNTDTVAARAGWAVPDGTCEFSEDYVTMQQISYLNRYGIVAKIRSLFPMNFFVETLIDDVAWTKSWRWSKQGASSSISGFYFGHYIAGAS